MSVITLVPSDSTVVIDGEVATTVNFAGLDPLIHAISWFGAQGILEFIGNPITGEKPQNEVINSLAPYQSYVTQAQDIIYARNNPVYYYSTVNELLYQGDIYGFGEEIIVESVGWPQPPTSTPSVPPTPENWQTLYWYDDAWLVSSFDPNLLLADAQASLIAVVNQNAAIEGNNEARIYSTTQLFAAADVNALLTADYPLVTLGDYQIFLDGQVTTLEATINAATTTEELYNFNPTVSGVYTPL